MKKWKKSIKSFIKSESGVSEIVGTVLLLGIAVAVFSTLYIVVLSHPSPIPPSHVSLIGTVEGKNIVIEHCGGEELSLNTEILIEISGEKTLVTVEDLLDKKSKEDGVWNVGERILYPFNYSIDYNTAEIKAIDKQGDLTVLVGTLDISPECDIGLQQSIDKKFPTVGDVVNIIIRTTNNRGDIGATDIKINTKLPDGLSYVNHQSTKGVYDFNTGIWEIKELAVGESVVINITAVVGIPHLTQLAILLDGSSSITASDWDIMIEGLSDAIKNETVFPHDSSVELTIIQFGSVDPAIAQVEIGPIIVNNANYKKISKQIVDIVKLGNATPTACAINLAADTLANSSNFDSSNRHIINLVTDGEPNCICKADEYTGKWMGNGPNAIAQGKASAQEAQEYLLKTLNMTSEQDEFDAEAVGTEPDLAWLRDYIVWPGGFEWTEESLPGPGWVRKVSDYKEFAEILDELFEILFWDITHTVKIISSTPRDFNPQNNQVYIRIKPKQV